MSTKNYIFLTLEGHTFQPDSESTMPDVENVQMLGIATGDDQPSAFRNLVAESQWLLATTFDEVYCYELAPDFPVSRAEFSLKVVR